MIILQKVSNSRTQSTEIRGEIEEIWKFNNQLRVILKKSETKDQNKKDTKIWGLNWSSSGVKLHKIESLKPINHKSKD
jgi:hypothetical protein